MRLLIATRNRGKAAEMEAILKGQAGGSLEVLTLADVAQVPEPPEEGETFAENARAKALYYAGVHRLLCVADDSGLVVSALWGRPGVRSARFASEKATDEENIALLLAELAGRERPWDAAFVCHAVAALPERIVAEAVGRVAGEIIPERRGTGGFGYDPVFLVREAGKTMAELSAAEKNRISHRGEAIRRLAAELSALGILRSLNAGRKAPGRA